MDDLSASSTTSKTVQTPLIMDSISTIRASNEHGLDAFLARAELAKVGWCLGQFSSLSVCTSSVALARCREDAGRL